DRLEETLKEVRKHLAPERKVLAFSVDLTVDAQDVENTIDQACESLGPVDILINCAGFAVCGLFEETTVDQFKAMINTNYLAGVYTSHSVVKRMKERRKGHIVFVSSIGGQFGIFGFSAYAASKFAVRGFAETLFMEVKPYNIGVSVVFPPDTDTPGFENENKGKPSLQVCEVKLPYLTRPLYGVGEQSTKFSFSKPDPFGFNPTQFHQDFTN
ncbi:unnamed protein product, partial [Porites evermanni]